MTSAKTEVLGIVCAALVPAAGLSLVQVLGDRTVGPSVGALLGWALIVFLVSVPVAVMAWCCAVLLLDRFGWVNAATALLAGGATGALASLAFTYPIVDFSPGFLLWVGLGMLSGLAFWIVRALAAT